VPSGSQSARRGMQRSGLARVAGQLAAPVAMGLLIGGVLAYQAGSTNNTVQPVPLGAVPTPTPSFGKPSPTATGAALSPSPTRLTPAASLAPSTAATPAVTAGNAAGQTPTANASGR
jgi:hypothetical protein